MSAPFGEFVDLFNGDTINPRWTLFDGTPVIADGVLVADDAFDMSSGAAFPTMGHVTGAFTGKYSIQRFRTSLNFGSWHYVNTFPYVDYLGFDIAGGDITISSSDVTPGTPVFTATYSQTTHRATRIREDSGTLYAETWDGSVWTTRFSVATPSWIAGTDVSDSHGGYIDGSPDPDENVTIYSYNVVDESVPTMGFPFVFRGRQLSDTGEGLVGVRRSIGINGTGSWENSADPGSFGGWNPPSWGMPLLAGANGRWILIGDDFIRSGTPNVVINNSPNLDPNSWGTPFYLISSGFCADIYGAMGSGLHANFRRLNFGNSNVIKASTGASTINASKGPGNANHRLKFLSNPDHLVGGRWWILGSRDTLIYSDTNGDSWSNSLSDHTGIEANMHPFLNWRRTYPDAVDGNLSGGLRYTYPTVMDMANDPKQPERVMAIGVTYLASSLTNRTGITNRLAVFSISDDFGDTWTTPGQLPIGLSRISGYNAISAPNAGNDHVAMATNIFPRIV